MNTTARAWFITGTDTEIGKTHVACALLHAARRAGLTADVVLVEGAGGLLVPLDETRDFADLARHLDLPVILVVGMRLGCINHALLTCEAIATRGLHFAGWVANRVEPYMARFDENLATLEARIRAPLLGVVPHGDPAEPVALRLPD